MRILSLKWPSVNCSPSSTGDCEQSLCDIETRPGPGLLEFDVVQAVVQLLPSSVVAGVALFLQRLPSLLPVFEPLPCCPPSVALHHHCGSPSRSQDEHGVEVGVVEHPLDQIVVPSRGRLLLSHEDIVDVEG